MANTDNHKILSLNDLPHVRGYLSRVGAQPVSLRKARREEDDAQGYPVRTGEVKFDKTGNVFCWGVEPPTAEEKAKIQEEFRARDWPHTVPRKADDFEADMKYPPGEAGPKFSTAAENRAREKEAAANRTPLEVIRDGINGRDAIEDPEELAREMNFGMPDFEKHERELASAEWKARMCGRPTWTPFYDHNGDVIFVEARYDYLKKPGEVKGRKRFASYTFWSDGEWREGEPEWEDEARQPLPLYGLEKLTAEKRVVVLVEGTKTAKAARAIAEGKVKGHPWAEALADPSTVILGFLGATRPHLTDWSPLKVLEGRENARVVVVADNDPNGKAAIGRIARELRCFEVMVDAIEFDARWPEHFDLANPWPMVEGEDGKAHAIEYAFDDEAVPVTLLTKMVPNKDGKEVPALRDIAAKYWRVVTIEEKPLYIPLYRPHAIYTEQGFNAKTQQFSHSTNTAQLLKMNGRCVADAIAYRPGWPREFQEHGTKYVNTYTPGFVVPVEGDEGPWERYMEHLIPDPTERWKAELWAATVYVQPAWRCSKALLLASLRQGTGKTTFFYVLAVLVGRHNASFTKARRLLDSPFNTPILRKLLVIVNEIYSGNSYKDYQDLKEYISDETIEAHEKFKPPYTIENYSKWGFGSNARVPLAIDDGDGGKERRLYMPEMTEEAWPQEEWDRLYAWLRNGGYAIVAARWGRIVKEKGPFPRDVGFIATERKDRLLEDSRSQVDVLCEGLVGALNETGKPWTANEKMVWGWLEGNGIDVKDRKPKWVRQYMQKHGAFVSRDRVHLGGGVKEFIFASDEERARMTWGQAKECLADVKELEGQGPM
ncbi:DUF5906 domain-containing protein [Xanthobacter variabilis]|uniref:DUF5906 domain-containing protein n=1 Tax=Xanthobacter variabilis TaxID=3119932 RepID=UPI00372B6AC8